MQPEHDLQIFQNVTYYVTYVTYFMLHYVTYVTYVTFSKYVQKTVSDIRERLSEVSK